MSDQNRNAPAPIAGAVNGAILGFAAASLVGVPGQVPLVALTFIVFVFWAVAPNRPEPPTSAAISRGMWVVISTIVVLFLAHGLAPPLGDGVRVVYATWGPWVNEN